MRLSAMSFLGLAPVLAAAVIGTSGPATAEGLVGFPREDFGKVVLSSRQLAGGADLEASFGNYANEPVANYDPRSIIRRLGRSVGRLDIRTNVRTFPCTGFLVSEKYLLTNYHCVPGVVDLPEAKLAGVKRIDGVQIVLGYTKEGVAETAEIFSVSPEPVEADRELDYAILEVFGGPAKTFGTLKLAAVEPLQNAPLVIIGHPLGKAQSVSREQCKSDAPAVSAKRLRHTCDTLPGNSGSPVIDDETRNVIALHHAGSARNTINYAVPLAEIVKTSPILRGLIEGGRVAKLEVPPPTPAPAPLAPERCPGVEVDVAGSGKRCLDPQNATKREFQDCFTVDGKRVCGPQMVVVPAGKFLMGSTGAEIEKLIKDYPATKAEWFRFEAPEREVTMPRPFAVGVTHVTRGQFAAFVAATGHKTDGGCWAYEGTEWKNNSDANWRAPGFVQDDNHPVVCVNWNDAQAYVDWLKQTTASEYRLLTEAETEYVARATTRATRQPRYFYGNDVKDLCAYGNGADLTAAAKFNWDKSQVPNCNDRFVYTAPVGSFAANAFGVKDVHGNAWSWTQDCFVDSYKDAPTDGTKAVEKKDCQQRVVRGGSWFSYPVTLRSADRYWGSAVNRYGDDGFRVARPVVSPRPL
jgi:formylglycine-generating enzyme required for sulfatase activity/V8-like Glu-specific endopeptidase